MNNYDKIIYFFGATGDLARRKIWQAIANLFIHQGNFKVIAFGGIHVDSTETFRQWLECTLEQHRINTELLLQHVDYHSVDLLDQKAQLPIPSLTDTSEHVFYVALSTHIYLPLLAKLSKFLPHQKSRIVLEKPIGTHLNDALTIQNALRSIFKEDQIYRIDHYLGKWTVQNVLALRFANSLFEHQWNQKYIDHIQISIAETLGIETRSAFYDNIGALRDMVQNHLVQLLCLIAMEPPANLNPEAIRDERVKVLRALRPLSNHNVVRGQYVCGQMNGKTLPGYLESLKTSNSNTETFIALKAEINNWRWANVPFYLRTGKRMPTKCCEIVVQFKDVPHPIFKNQASFGSHNRLIFRLQPKESIKLELFEQTNDNRKSVRPIQLSLDAPNFRGETPDAYERLLQDALNGDPTLFVREDEWSQAWRWVDPVLNEWEELAVAPFDYPAGSWGPTESINLLARERRTWENPTA